jgi:serine protease AprX
VPGNKVLDGAAASNWVLEHQQNPCRPAQAQTVSDIDPACPPIRVTNHSYGPDTDTTNGNRFDPNSAEVVIQRALVKKGVVSVWSAGNSGGDGSRPFTNPAGMDPTPGIVMVANYDDGGTTQRKGQLSRTSSRGEEGEPDSYPDLAAPGTRITSACRPQLSVCSSGDPITGGSDGVDYATISGTSMAAPYVAAVAAQLFQTDPRLTPARIEHLLKKTAYRFTAGAPYETDPTGGRTSFDKGHGLIDVYAALAAARPLTTRR